MATPAEVRLTPEELKAATIEHDYYRLSVLKPEGFFRDEVDPDKEEGIYLALRREDEHRNLCEIRIRVHLGRTLAKTAEDLAREAISKFEGRYEEARVPKRPPRARWRGATHAFRAAMVGTLTRTGLVLHQDYLVLDHENTRVYEIEMTMYAGAKREFRKEIAAFWRSLKILPK